MYKILIVDDEKMIRMGIKKVIDWEALGICEVFTASSAREALEIIEEYEPEIMITDIQMSEMTGLQLIEAARKRQPKLRVLVLTGYDSFEYARQSLRLQVQDLFLKPVDEEVLSKAVKAQVEYLEAAKAEEKSSLILQRTQGTVEQTQLEKIMRDLIHTEEEKYRDFWKGLKFLMGLMVRDVCRWYSLFQRFTCPRSRRKKISEPCL